MTSELARSMEAEQAAVRRALLDDINEIELINSQLRPLEARKRILTDRVKQGMGLAGMDELADGETGVIGRIQERESAPLYDLPNAPVAAIAHAAVAGMLRLDHQMFDRFRKQNGATWADEIARTAMPGATTTALLVAKGNDR